MSSRSEDEIPPSELVRFRSGDRGMEFLSSGEMPIGFVDDFNDPFEFLMREFTEDSLAGLDPRELLRDPNSYIYTRSEELDSLTDEQCRIEVLSALKKAPDIFRDRIIGGFGVICFSSFNCSCAWVKPEIVLPFANYADNHRGMAFCFDQNHSQFTFFRRQKQERQKQDTRCNILEEQKQDTRCNILDRIAPQHGLYFEIQT